MKSVGILSGLAILCLVALGTAPAGAELDRSDVTQAVAAALAGHAGSLITHLDPDSDRLVVVDSSRRTVAVYQVSGAGLQFVDRRDLDPELLPGGVAPSPRPEPQLPAQDVPGEDPPGVPRPENALRTRVGYSQEHGRESWNALYLARGEVPSVFEELRARLDGWTIVRARVTTGNWYQAEIRARKGKDSLEIELDSRVSGKHPGFIEVSSDLRREES